MANGASLLFLGVISPAKDTRALLEAHATAWAVVDSAPDVTALAIPKAHGDDALRLGSHGAQ